MPRTLFALALVCHLLCACGSRPHPLHSVRMPESEEATGSVSLVFSSTARNLVLTINGKLVIDRVSLRRIQVQKVPAGYADIAIATQGVDRRLRVWVEAGTDTSLAVAGPPEPPRQNPVLTAGLSIFAFLLSRAATELLF